MTYFALENAKLIHVAINDWKEKFAYGAEPFKSMGGEALWHEYLGIWGFFWSEPFGTQPGRYWNSFGRLPFRCRQNIIVEINPPSFGINSKVQGVVARDDKNCRWIMHRGHLNARVISKSMLTTRDSVHVEFSDGSIGECYPVCNIELDPLELQERTASFVNMCARFRLGDFANRDDIEREGYIEKNEQESFPEAPGSYEKGSIEATTIHRRHADIWQALTKALDRRHIFYSNARVGRHGPDLRTFGSKPVLFEIKSDVTSDDIHKAVGQLMIYEQILAKKHQKVLIVPAFPGKAFVKAINSIGIEIITFTKKGKAITFDNEKIDDLFR